MSAVLSTAATGEDLDALILAALASDPQARWSETMVLNHARRARMILLPPDDLMGRACARRLAARMFALERRGLIAPALSKWGRGRVWRHA